MSTPPLHGVRVIDLTTSYAGPIATTYLADMGADVVKVERPPRGDDTRHWGPPFVGGESAWFLSANRGKRSVCLDVAQPAGRAALMRLVRAADVLVVSFSPRALDRLGLDAASLHAELPRLVYCALSGYGLSGPDRALAGYDLVAQARSGLMSVTGPAGGAPQRVSTALTDIVAGTIASFAIAAALRRQALHGVGEVIDVSLLEAGLSLMAPRVVSYLAGEPEPRPSGATDSVISVYQGFETADRPIVVAIGNDAIWRRFCDAVGMTEHADDPGLASNAQRREQRDRLVAEIAARLRERPAAEWLAAFAAARVPSAPIQFLSDVVRDPQVEGRGTLVELEHAHAGRVKLVAPPWRLGPDSRVESAQEPAPPVGAHTHEVLLETGYGEHEIDELIEGGAAWAQQTPTA